MKNPKSFTRYELLAKRFLKAGRLPSLLFSAARKRDKLGSGFSELKENLKLFQSLCVAWVRGEYRQIKPRALLAVVGALIYFVSPIDAIPDWLLGVGFIDDLAVLGWVIKKWADELSAFKQWRATQAEHVVKDLERLPDQSAS